MCVLFLLRKSLSLCHSFLAFGENVILTAHPSKTGGDWWYGTLVRDGKSGLFPKTYVQTVDNGRPLVGL